jgi:serine phosphatase RsbU (regulator of sigma subunit)
VQIPVGSDDKAILYTDGILETNNPSQEMLGVDRFKRFVEDNHDVGAGQLADSLLDELSRWSGHPKGVGQEDDITLLVIDFKNPE